jgi:hypothetical protein
LKIVIIKKPGNYLLPVSLTGYVSKWIPLFAGSLSQFLDLGLVELEQDNKALEWILMKETLPKKIIFLLNKIVFI